MSKQPEKNIVLCGFMGSGKTTLGGLLAKRLGIEFVDMDDVIIEREGKTVPELFAEGEQVFRDAEHRAAVELSSRSGMVIATGGGALTFQRNVDALRSGCTILFLNPGFEVCYERIKNSDRPLVRKNTKEQLDEMYNLRRSQYRAAAHREIAARGTMEECVDEMVDALAQESPVAFTIRDYAPADAPRLIELWLASTTKSHPFIPAAHWHENIPRLEQQYLPAARTRICEANGRIIGFLSVLNEDFIGALFVDVDAQSRGIGQALMQDAQTFYDHLGLAVYQQNGQAVSFYTKHGFYVHEEVVDEETHLPQYIMCWYREDM